ncbi:hypothetical protein Rs2_22094 [Raphanus sativus]|nr:hypothetical protein Rs2_22094 [Raphanus sativus]
MASSVVSSFQPRSSFLGDINVSKVSTTPQSAQVGFSTKTIECKESMIGKQPIDVPSNITITLEGQDLKVKGPLEELALTYPREVKLTRLTWKELVLNLGFSHPVKMQIPKSLRVKVEENTRITVSGYGKSEIGQFAATVRKWRPPEPYKGKGVKYSDEIVRRKEGKAGKKK